MGCKNECGLRHIIQGTTPYLYFDIDPEETVVSEVTNAELTIRHLGNVTKKPFGALILDPDANAVGYHFTQKDTLAFRAGKDVTISLICMVGEERVQSIPPLTLTVLPSDEIEEMEAYHGE